jgi:hypothetical protein
MVAVSLRETEFLSRSESTTFRDQRSQPGPFSHSETTDVVLTTSTIGALGRECVSFSPRTQKVACFPAAANLCCLPV